MYIKINYKGLYAGLSITYSKQMKGVNSILSDSRHALFWDFDNVDREEVIKIMLAVQQRWQLPPIYVLNTGLPKFWHCYCFYAVSYGLALHILAETPRLDKAFFKIGVIRGYWTLRYSKKEGRTFTTDIILPSIYYETVTPNELSILRYWTKRL